VHELVLIFLKQDTPLQALGYFAVLLFFHQINIKQETIKHYKRALANIIIVSDNFKNTSDRQKRTRK